MTKEKPLLGLPFTSKNSIAIRGMRHDAGSLYWHGRRAEEDAPSVASLRRAGAIPLALTNVPELCMWGESHNLVDGCTRNPHDTRRSPGGSSGGEGSLLAAAGSLIGLGTDAAGSVRIPSAYCGIFGHKPTAGANCKSSFPYNFELPFFCSTTHRCSSTVQCQYLTLFENIVGRANGYEFDSLFQVNLKALKLYYMDNEGSLFISRVTTDMRRAVRRVTQYLTAAHGLEANQLHLPEMRFGMYEWFKVIAIKNPTPLAQIFRPGGFNTLVELLRHVVGAGRHTLAALLSSKFSPLYRFRSQQKAEAFVASIENARDRFEETLGDDGVLSCRQPRVPHRFRIRNFYFLIQQA
ncbi:hypothetical protein HPB52_024874 [Rhipicephalus sanguineus]|uniref:Amidase domain-containing protein n=1 Tax=Rhipicephalus sanguineus TaxID=34632 RepID=A0A9D4YRN4_RHISA|nr:hypothetical protein HPB52_024874 [Rhipicephalus sanguineus]